jgi:hypothetical protein
MKLEFLTAQGTVVRTYSSTDPVRSPDPATDPAAYNKLCQQTPSLPDCGLPLYWPAPPQFLKTTPGMHRFTWDMHYDPLPGATAGRGDGSTGAVPHRTYPVPTSPWVPPGTYTARLTANGKTVTQPIVIKMDPRVKITPDIQQIFTLTAQAEARAQAIVKTNPELANAIVASVMPLQAADMPPTAAQLEAISKQLKK